MILTPTVRTFWSGLTESEPTEQVDPMAYIDALHADGYDHAVDGTLPRSATSWPVWLILATRPRFAASVPPWARIVGAAAFRAGFLLGILEREGVPR